MQKMTRKEKTLHILSELEKIYPDAQTELHYRNDFELLVAVILSAQCTDRRVNAVTPELFRRFPDARTMAQGSPEEIFHYIRSISYPHAKSRNLNRMAGILHERFQGKVPASREDLESLPGVGRKTANVVLSILHRQPTLAVDTHVFRVSARLGLTRDARNPLQTEKQLLRLIPPDKIPVAHHLLILHGRYTCQARKPGCEKCSVKKYCTFFKKVLSLNKNNGYGKKEEKKRIGKNQPKK